MSKRRINGEIAVRALLNIHSIEYRQEVRFHPTRMWRFDFALLPLSKKIAIEVEGGVWSMGRHTRGSGYIGDMEKYNEAAILGWTVLRYPASNITDKIIKDLIRMENDRRQNTSPKG